MIVVYFDNIHFNLFYNQVTKTAIYSTKESKEREFVQRIHDKENYIICLWIQMKIVTTKGDGKAFKRSMKMLHL